MDLLCMYNLTMVWRRTARIGHGLLFLPGRGRNSLVPFPRFRCHAFRIAETPRSHVNKWSVPSVVNLTVIILLSGDRHLHFGTASVGGIKLFVDALDSGHLL